MKITVVYDNHGGKNLNAGWGFSCLLEAHGKKILFDSGDDGKALLFNMEKLGITPQEVDCIFISHGHMDHCGGLASFLGVCGNLPVFVPHSAYKMVKNIGPEAQVKAISEPQKLYDGFYTTGELKGIEQSLVVKGEKGNVVICGCAHPGLENIIEKAREFGEVYGVVGGFHGFDKFVTLENVRIIIPCHCTQYKNEIAKRFPESYAECHTGAVFEV